MSKETNKASEDVDLTHPGITISTSFYTLQLILFKLSIHNLNLILFYLKKTFLKPEDRGTFRFRGSLFRMSMISF